MLRRTSAFTVASALAQGTTRERIRSLPLDQPFHGMRASPGSIRDHLDLCFAYAVKMGGSVAFSGPSAAIIWGLPLPMRFSEPDRVSVSTALPLRAARGRGVVGRSHDPERVRITTREHLRVLSPVDTWCSLASILDLVDLVAVGDAVVTPPFAEDEPLSTVDELRAAAARHTGTPGAERMRRAVDLIRVGPLSRPESLYRMVCVAAGLPEPVSNLRTVIAGEAVMLDSAWPEYRVATEYDGDHHRTRVQFQAGLRRATLIRDEWALLQIGSSALFVETRATVTRTAALLRAGGWRPSRGIDVTRVPRLTP